MIEVYCDGGVVGKNPSPVGGTWAWVSVRDGIEDTRDSGLILATEVGMDAISNNYSELEAAVQALEAMPDGWCGTIYTDSNVTRCRIKNKKPSMKGIPEALQVRMWKARKRLGRYTVVLLDGHPTTQQLRDGVGKRGHPVSMWNVMCDGLCNQAKSLAPA